MSRVGKKLIPVPSGVKIQIGKTLKVQGPKGTLEVPVPEGGEHRLQRGGEHVKEGLGSRVESLGRP